MPASEPKPALNLTATLDPWEALQTKLIARHVIAERLRNLEALGPKLAARREELTNHGGADDPKAVEELSRIIPQLMLLPATLEAVTKELGAADGELGTLARAPRARLESEHGTEVGAAIDALRAPLGKIVEGTIADPARAKDVAETEARNIYGASDRAVALGEVIGAARAGEPAFASALMLLDGLRLLHAFRAKFPAQHPRAELTKIQS